RKGPGVHESLMQKEPQEGYCGWSQMRKSRMREVEMLPWKMLGVGIRIQLDHCLFLSLMMADSPLGDTDPKDFCLIPKNIMAEPDYIEDDNPELIKPQKLINPVKTSRNHQDLHRELLMNQKRGLAPQNKPELQKVMEKRKRDQVIKQKKEEAQKKKSDLELELLKRQQKLEQLELEKQKLQEEQENAPEFVKMKRFLGSLEDELDCTEDIAQDIINIQTLPWHLMAVQATQINMTLVAEWPLDTKMATGDSPEPRHIPVALVATWVTGVNTEPSYSRTTDPDMALDSSLDP
ncbi:hypothetical protein STEG23_037689, partial [Scotinomys teguina]